MFWKIFVTTFIAIFLAELGDKTQLAVIALTAQTKSMFTVLLAATAAMFVVTLIGVLFGELLTKLIPLKYIHFLAGSIFILFGILTIIKR